MEQRTPGQSIAYVRGMRSCKRPEAGKERALGTAERRSGDLMNPNDRWQFGMRLMGYEDARADCMPEPTNKKD